MTPQSARQPMCTRLVLLEADGQAAEAFRRLPALRHLTVKQCSEGACSFDFIRHITLLQRLDRLECISLSEVPYLPPISSMCMISCWITAEQILQLAHATGKRLVSDVELKPGGGFLTLHAINSSIHVGTALRMCEVCGYF